MAGFSIYPRKRKNGRPIFYAQFKNPDGSYTVAKSTGCTSRSASEKWCEEYLQKYGSPLPGREISLERYAKDFFIWTGKWATNKRVEGHRISERHCRDRADLMRIHVLPVFGHLVLSKIDKNVIRDFRNDFYSRGYSSSLINKCLYALKTILETAEDEGLIQTVPIIKKVTTELKSKGILTIDEVNRLFAFQWMSKPIYCHPPKPQIIGYAGNLLTASTGLRISELQAIRIQDLHLDDGYITIKHSWDNRLNKLNETTKTGRERNIYIPGKVIQVIVNLLTAHPCPSDLSAYLFWGEKKPKQKPAEKIVFIRSLFEAMEHIGINKDERKRRNITFHSWRYFLNSLLINAKIPLQKVQLITGHLTDQMSQHYYKQDDMADVRLIQEKLFSGSI
jgi:integrase